MWTIITQEILMKFKVKLMSTGRRGSNNDSNKQLSSCRFLHGVEKFRCGGSFGSRACCSQLGPFPLPLTAPPLGWPGVSNSQQMGEVTNWEQSLGLQEGSYRWRKMLLHLVTEKPVECFMLFSSAWWFCFPAFPTINSQTSLTLSICISVFVHICYHRTSHK